jgi:hypothetical protein
MGALRELRGDDTKNARTSFAGSPWNSWAVAALRNMRKSKYTAQIDNIYFLSRIGATLRWATRDIGREELPADVKRLLGRLERLEARVKAKNDDADGDS